MKFDVVIGNPPYNSDIYLDFVQAGFEALKPDGVMVMITPAKWQAKGGDKNEAFRQNIVPHMKELVYWPDCKDVFDIGQIDGISIYSVDKTATHETQRIKNVCSMQKHFESDWVERSIVHRETLHNNGQRIINRLGNYKAFKFRPIDRSMMYYVYNNTQMASGSRDGMTSCLLTTEGNSQFIGLSVVKSKNEPKPTSSTAKVIFTSNDLNEAMSFKSWIDTKFTRYFLAINIGKLSNTICDDFFRLVPDPGAFDHIFTDAELYQKYGLTQDEINIIESVIKERK